MQVWPQLNVLMAIAAQSGESSQEGEGEEEEGGCCFFAPPSLSFAWMKILLNSCLQSQMAPIKKLIMHEILA